MENTSLQHHGILGMKWGVRRTQAQLARAQGRVAELEEKLARKTGGKSKSSDQQSDSATPAPKKRRLSEVPDDELNRIVNRLQLEQRYKQLNPQKVSKGRKFIDNILAPAATDAGKKLLSNVFMKIGNKAINKMFDGDKK